MVYVVAASPFVTVLVYGYVLYLTFVDNEDATVVTFVISILYTAYGILYVCVIPSGPVKRACTYTTPPLYDGLNLEKLHTNS